MHIRALTSASLLAIAGASFAADDGTWDFYIRAQASATLAKLGGDAAYSTGSMTGTSFSASDVGLGDSSVTPNLELGLGMPLFDFHAHLGWSQFSTDGSGTVSKSVNFGGQTYAAGQKVSSKAEITDLYLEACWAPIALDVAGFSLGIAAHQLDVTTSLSNSTVGKTEFSETAILPTLAVRAYVSPIDMLEVEAMVHGLSVPVGDASGTFVYGQVQAAYYPYTYIGVIAGYRYAMIDVEIESGHDKAKADVTLSGPYLGVAAQF